MNSYAICRAIHHNPVVTISLAMFLATSSGWAQPASDGPNELEEIVVTAQKRVESLQRVPMSATVLTAIQLSELKLDTPSDLTTYFPNLQVNAVNGDASPLFSLRGVSMFDFSLNQSSPVGSYVDEVYKGNVVLFGVEMYDLERIEVLRGPQGTLYGKNTTGGAINFITVKPDFDTEAELSLGFGDYDRKEAQGMVQAALVPDRIAVRVAATYTEADGVIENVYPGAPDLQSIDQYGVRSSLLYRASDSLDFTLRYSKSTQNPQNYGIIADNIATAPPFGPGIGGTGYFRTSNGMENGIPLTLHEIDQSDTPRRRQDNQAVALTGNWKISPSLSLTSITSWDEGSLYVPDITDGAPISVVRNLVGGDTRQFTQDLRLTSATAARYDFIVGAYYQHQVIRDTNEAQFFNFLDLTGDGLLDSQDCAAASFAPPGFGVGYASGAIINPACRYYNSFEQTMRSWSVYADGSYQVSPRVKLRAGARYNEDRGTQDNALQQLRGTDDVPIANLGFFSLQPGGYYAPELLLPGSPNYDTLINETRRQDLHDTAVTGRAGIDFTPTEDTLLYLGYSRGYRSAAFNAQFLFAPSDFKTVEPESLDSIELGFKTAWFENRLQLNGAVFHYQYRNQQIINSQPNGEQPLVNLPKSRINGGELEFVTRPVRSLTVRAGLGVLDTKVQEGVIQGEDIDGHELPTAPSLSGTLAGDWDVSLGPAILTLHVDGSYTSKQYFEVINLDRIAQGDYALVNASVAIRSVDNKWTVAVWGSNLTDKTFFTNGANLQGLGFDYRHIGAPRTYGLTASYRYGGSSR